MAPLRHLCLVAVVTAAVPPAAAEPLVRAAAAALEVPNIGDVRGRLTLPTTGSHGTTITWRSSDDEVISYGPAATTRLTGPADFREGLFMVERQGTYHLSWSVDDTRSEDYRVAYATAPSPPAPSRTGV
ncbi:immunoglobulin-like domain-containing protein [Lentzea sp. DG1S-22]|uniref:immunoglobulin-like domain-containing protein n=1 Tax=Lentzea sp. DG1S-22 TaxID=3108822 RepID=UPI002E79290B|nr:immunoglobulin-like domain-containing protein [Lentzea sp. DG1S-22]WVH81657.1 immunoglobulin-like domain-containing protein [Lentzea sp. DG1S-22]